ncbi:yrdC domain-containing protein, mitochondrial [Lampris incognitus]|uniref:yrdC domain-containing protein, mitochondrial n=1 Tax=Lampris incognitus TaxID=2546036 RepID=UPI0024B55451|nr:yrdC domain-containing protein, mitochondrial [Lampris incognitus]
MHTCVHRHRIWGCSGVLDRSLEAFPGNASYPPGDYYPLHPPRFRRSAGVLRVIRLPYGNRAPPASVRGKRTATACCPFKKRRHGPLGVTRKCFRSVSSDGGKRAASVELRFMKCVYHAGVKLIKLRSMTSLPRQAAEMKAEVLRFFPRTSNGLSAQHEGPSDGAETLSSTVKALKEGHVVAVPTDTIYGIACLAQNTEAIRKVYDIKGRNGQKPLAICVGEIQDIFKYCKVNVKEELLGDLLPGPVTLVFERSEALNTEFNPFTPLVGVRIPDHTFMRQLCQMCKEPLALTSANISTHTSSVAINEFEVLWPGLAIVVDGGPIGDQSRTGSTVIDLSVLGKYRVIRPGCALSATVDVLKRKYGLSEDPGDE